MHDSDIIAGGDVSIQGGFSGTGIGKIVSGGNVCARFIRNQTIYCRGSIKIDKEVVDANYLLKMILLTEIKKQLLLVGI